MKYLVVTLLGWLLCVSAPVLAYGAQTGSLEVIMKTFSFQYRQAVEAQTVELRLRHVHEMQAGIVAAQQAPMREDMAETFVEGFQKVAAKLDGIEQALLAGDMVSAEQKLQQIDRLRVEYHRLRKRSFWQWLFGGR